MSYVSVVAQGAAQVVCPHGYHATVADAAQCGRERSQEFGGVAWTVQGADLAADGTLRNRPLTASEQAELDAIQGNG